MTGDHEETRAHPCRPGSPTPPTAPYRSRSTRPRRTRRTRSRCRRSGTTVEVGTRRARRSSRRSPRSRAGRTASLSRAGWRRRSTLLLTLRPGDHVVLADDVYGGTYRLLTKVFGAWGLESTTCDLADLDADGGRPAPRDQLRLDRDTVEPVAEDRRHRRRVGRRARGGSAASSSTTRSRHPALQRPFALGADVVVHSVTKYIGGHSDLIGGAVITSHEDLRDRLAFLVNAVGAVPGPMDAYLALRGLQDLGGSHGPRIARTPRPWRRSSPPTERSKVHYPGIESHPGHDVAARQMRGFGGMVSFDDRVGATRPRRWHVPRGCSSWPNRSAASSR